MPTYELALMIRAMPKAELKTSLKRISHAIFDRGGIIRNIENLGFRPMPYKTSAHGLVHKEANYFVIKMDTATRAVADLSEEYSRDVDVVRQRIFRSQEPAESNCTLEEELLPPAYREEVQKMIEVGKTQIQVEQQAAQNYLKMAVNFLHPSTSLPGTGGFFMKMYQEEIRHMHEFIHYQIMRGGTIAICGLEPPMENKNLSLIDAFNHALKMEQEITKQIEDIIKVAEDVEDRHSADFLTSTFLNEQIESIHEMATHVTKLKRLSNNKHALYHYDLELAKQYPYPWKTK